jgi:hypothetical protein
MFADPDLRITVQREGAGDAAEVLVWARKRFDELAVRGLSDVTRSVFVSWGLDHTMKVL